MTPIGAIAAAIPTSSLTSSYIYASPSDEGLLPELPSTSSSTTSLGQAHGLPLGFFSSVIAPIEFTLEEYKQLEPLSDYATFSYPSTSEGPLDLSQTMFSPTIGRRRRMRRMSTSSTQEPKTEIEEEQTRNINEPDGPR